MEAMQVWGQVVELISVEATKVLWYASLSFQFY
jgi:hypothetical protein